MLSETIRACRKAKGFSQEELAARLHVARQTISKWEKGYSVPDADLLARLADELEVSVGELLGGKPAQETPAQDAVAGQLGRICEQMAVRNRQRRFVIRLVVGVLLGTLLFWTALVVLGFGVYEARGPAITQTETIPEEARGPAVTQTETVPEG